MFDKRKCKKCKWHGNISFTETFCYYARIGTNGTCLKKIGDKIIDQRGTDPKNCLLFEKAIPEDRRKRIIQ
jgi:hypothetical protein